MDLKHDTSDLAPLTSHWDRENLGPITSPGHILKVKKTYLENSSGRELWAHLLWGKKTSIVSNADDNDAWNNYF